MGCSGSSAAPADTLVFAESATAAKSGGQTKGTGKGSVKGKGKGGHRVRRFQIKLVGEFKDYDSVEDAVLKKAYLVGQPNCRFRLRGQSYEYNFTAMEQKNLGTKKTRAIRPPLGMKPPPSPLLPIGPMVVITVPKGSAGKEIEIDDPNNKGKKLKVNVPPGAKAGQKMAIPIPEAGQSVEEVQEKQRSHGTAAKLAMGVAGIAAVGGLAVGGVVLGDHLTGGELGAADAAADAGEAVAEWTAGAAEDVAEWTTGAAEDVADWAGPAAEAAGEWTEGAFEDTVEWLEEAGEDIGDFVTSLF